VIVEDALYSKLAIKAVRDYGSVKALSRALNDVLSKGFARDELPSSMFGCWRGERLDLSDLREEGEPH